MEAIAVQPATTPDIAAAATHAVVAGPDAEASDIEAVDDAAPSVEAMDAEASDVEAAEIDAIPAAPQQPADPDGEADPVRDPTADAAVAPAPSAPANTVATATTVRRPSRSTPKATPSFARRPIAGAARDPRRRWRVSFAIAALALLLALQLLLADRAELARDARWRPALASLCGVLHCTLPPWRELSAFTLLNRDVRAAQPGVLHVTATFRNDARWPQPWPALLLTLSDVDGRAAGARAFTPRQYLGTAPAQDLVASGQSATIAFDILEPTPRIVAFAFDFR